MAIYSQELMRRAGNQLAYDHSMIEGYLTASFITDAPRDLVSSKPLIAYEKAVGSSGSYNNTDQINTVSFRLSNTAHSFDPFADTSHINPINDVLSVDDGRLYLDLIGWITTAGLASVLGHAVYQHASWELGLHHYRDASSNYVRRYYPIARIGVAVRSAHEADLPENWIGATNPDMRFVIDPTDTSYKMEFTDFRYDATSLFCESKRCVFNGDDYRASFVQAPYSAT